MYLRCYMGHNGLPGDGPAFWAKLQRAGLGRGQRAVREILDPLVAVLRLKSHKDVFPAG